MPACVRTAEASDDEVELVDALAILSISRLGLPRGLLMNLSGEASRSFLSISRSASFILAIEIERQLS
jgi:hypothetical protein